MSDAESVADLGERWLEAWCNDPDASDDERGMRAWLAEGWRSATLETVMSWWRDQDERRMCGGMTVNELNVASEARSNIELYRGTLHALPVWRSFTAYRSEGLPVPEFILAKFDQWAGRLAALFNQAAAGELNERTEGAAILRALEFVGDEKTHKGMRNLAGIERRRRTATEIERLRKRLTWLQVAREMKMPVQAAEDAFYEFAPGPRRGRRPKPDASAALAEAHRRMVEK